jgi:hypothetical protein
MTANESAWVAQVLDNLEHPGVIYCVKGLFEVYHHQEDVLTHQSGILQEHGVGF